MYKFANSDHTDLIVGTKLEQGKGITHGVFDEAYTTQNQTINIEAADAPPIQSQFQHIYVKEVVRNPSMNYWKVPRLGSYMAIPLVYKSSLSVSSFQYALTDLADYEKRIKA